MKIDLGAYGLNPRFPEVIDSSMLKDYIDCPSLFYLRHVLGLKKRWRGINYSDDKFDWGTLWHKVLETYDLVSQTDPSEAVTEALSCLNNFPLTIDPKTDRHGRSPQRMAKMFFDYVQLYRAQDLEEYEFIRGEQFFDVFDEELGLRWCGRMDKVVRRIATGTIRAWDYKTASRMGDGYFEGHEFGFQFPGYVWATNLLVTEPVNEIVLDVAYCLKAKHEFFRRTFRYTPHQLKEWANNVKMILDEMYHLGETALDNPEAWKKNWNHCTRWGRCNFADVHWTPSIGDTRLRILQEDYHEERWDPRIIPENSDEAA